MTRHQALGAAAAATLVAVYALPLFWPPAATLPLTSPNAGPLERLFPGVPPLWIIVRLLALAAAALALMDLPVIGRSDVLRAEPPDAAFPPRPRTAWVALAFSVLQALAAPWAGLLGPLGQTAWVGALFVPAIVLARGQPTGRRILTPRARAGAMATVAIIAGWTVLRLLTDVGAPRAADAVDGWRALVGLARFVARGENLLTDRWDADLPGLSALPLLFMGEPLIRAGLLPMRLATAQVVTILSIAATAGGLALLARQLVGRGAAPVAVAVFLFAPYTLFVAVLPGPFVAGPLYATALTVAALAACRRRSEAALAALGPLGGIAISFPAVVPIAGFLAATTAWRLRRDWRRCWLGAATGLATLAAIVAPALPNVLAARDMEKHFAAHGSATLLEAALLGQAPLGTFAEARAGMTPRPLEIVAAALVEPFVNPRTPIRLWADAIFDPLGAALLAVGIAAALRATRRAPTARFLLLFYFAALAPAFVSPVDRVDIVHAAALQVPAALLAAAAFAGLLRRFAAGPPRRRATWTAAATFAIALGGIALFDAVNPKLLPASANGLVFRALSARDAPRAVVLDYVAARGVDVRWLFTGIMTAYGGPVPIGYLPYDGGTLPTAGLAAEGKDLVFWSPGLDTDLRPARAICEHVPDAVLYELRDDSGLARVLAARLGGTPWTPALARERVTERRCGGHPTVAR